MSQSPPEQNIFATPENDTFYRRRKYDQLNQAAHEIRLLRVHPTRLTASKVAATFPEWLECDTDAAAMTKDGTSAEESFLCCHLTKATDLKSIKKQYAALSYCAGKPTETKRIMVDGYWFNAFVNLEHALEGFRTHYERVSNHKNLLWTDQVCINQADFAERGHQVDFMRRIYESAEMTYVVLSTPESPIPDAQAGAAALRTMLKCLKAYVHGNSKLGSEILDSSGWGLQCWRFVLQLIRRRDLKHPALEALPQVVGFVDHTAGAKWWSRAWVGFLYLNSALCFHCPNVSAIISRFCKSFSFLTKYPSCAALSVCLSLSLPRFFNFGSGIMQPKRRV
jgi:hypothetical protein